MLKHATLMGAASIALFTVTSAAAQDADTVVATVGETDITLGEMIITRAQLPQQYSQFPDEVLFEGILDQLIQQQLLADQLESVPDRVELALTNERRSLLAGEVINEISLEAVTEAALQAAYDEAVADMEQTQEFNASHLLVETEEEAVAAKERIDAGEDFAEVAKETSTGPTGPNGGNLGWFGPGQMVPEFEATVQSLEVGEVSDPVQTQFGWHVVTLNETRESALPTLDELRGELSNEIQTAAIDARLATIREGIEVTMPEEGAFDPAILKNLDLLEPASE